MNKGGFPVEGEPEALYLETDELVYRDIAGNEGKRERIEEMETAAMN